MSRSEKILNAVKKYVSRYLKDNLSPDLTFHNIDHTLDVVHAAREIALVNNLSDEQRDNIEIAAWFHDCGCAQIYTGHETLSKSVASEFLLGHHYPENEIKQILECIEATRYPQNPQSIEAKIICDADLYHFTKPDYHRYESALRLELETYFNNKYTDAEWARTNCLMLENHEYFTDYGKKILQKFKAINLERLRSKALVGQTQKSSSKST